MWGEQAEKKVHIIFVRFGFYRDLRVIGVRVVCRRICWLNVKKNPVEWKRLMIEKKEGIYGS